MSAPKPRAGSRWRLLVHEMTGRSGYGKSHHVQSDQRDAVSSEHSTVKVLQDTEFDELVVGDWVHIEQMDTGRWWMNVAGVTLWVTADRDGKPTAVTVFGPGAYGQAVDGVTYEYTWPDSEERP